MVRTEGMHRCPVSSANKLIFEWNADELLLSVKNSEDSLSNVVNLESAVV